MHKISRQSNTITSADMDRISSLIRRESGLHFPASKSALVSSRLNRRLRRLNLDDFSSYLSYLESCDEIEFQSEVRELISALTTNVTGFFREPHHFEDLRRTQIPKFREMARSGDPIRIWSAGCSTGEEPYSIAITLFSELSELDLRDLKIIATDIDANAISIAASGVYSHSTLRNVSQNIVDSYFTELDSDKFRINPNIISLVRFNNTNITNSDIVSDKYDIIFCRNVMIYFDKETQNELIGVFRKNIKAGGKLYLGHSERIDPRNDHSFKPDGLTSYTAL